MRHLTLDPYIPLALWVPLALAAAGLLAWYAVAGRNRLPRRRWTVLVAMMGAGVAIPLLILLNPTWIERIPPPAGKPLLTILVDESASMDTADAGGGKTRRQVAQATAEEVKSRLGDRYEVQIVPFAGDPSAAIAEGATTDLAAAISSVMADDRPQGQAVLLLSDGIHNAAGGSTRVRGSADLAKAMAAPVFVKTIGGQAGVNDLEVQLNLSQELAFVGQRVPVVVTLHQRGSLATRTQLSLMAKGEVIEQREVELKPNGSTEEILYVTSSEPGLYQYEIRAEALPEEVTEVNNTAPLLVRVVDQPVRVLLLEGKPYWDTKFLIRTLSQDRSIELVSVVQLAEGRLLKRTIGRPQAKEGAADDELLPTTESWAIEKEADRILADPEELASYQIVILGRDADVFLGDESLLRLKKWLVEGDGSLVCFRGPPTSQISQRLGELLPVRWSPLGESRFRVEMTTAGDALRWLPTAEGDADPLSSLPSLAATARAERPKALAVVLASGSVGGPDRQSPAITYQPVGSGRVVVVEGAGMWRWAFLPPEHQQHDATYGTLWRSLVRWLVANVGLLPSQELALKTDKLTFSTTENATATLLVREDLAEGTIPQVELSGGALEQPRMISPIPSGKYPGQFRLSLGRLAEGRYWARVVGAADEVSSVAAFDVRGNLKERLDVRARADIMEMIAGQSGGSVLQQVEPEQLGQRFQRHLSESRPDRVTRTTAWDRLTVLLAGLALWGTTWGLRRRSGLV